MIGQNRQVALQQATADHDYVHTERELAENTEITPTIAALASRIEALTVEIHKKLVPQTAADYSESDSK